MNQENYKYTIKYHLTGIAGNCTVEDNTNPEYDNLNFKDFKEACKEFNRFKSYKSATAHYNISIDNWANVTERELIIKLILNTDINNDPLIDMIIDNGYNIIAEKSIYPN